MNFHFPFNRLCRFHAPLGMLLVLLQRTPVLRVVLPGAEYALSSTVGQVLKCAFGLAAMGSYNSLAGATTFNVISASGTATGAPTSTFQISGTVGTPINGTTGVTFSVSGAPVVPKSFGVTDDDFGGNYSDTLPPGLSVSPLSGVTAGGAPYYNTNLKLTITGKPTDPGVYRVRLWAAKAPALAGSTSELEAGYVVANFTISGAAVVDSAPAFTAQPTSQTIAAGNSVSFVVAASGSPAPTFQWRKSGVDIAGATNATHTIANVAAGDAGSYTVVATNRAGSVTSATATLTVTLAPALPVMTGQPVSVTVAPGQNAVFAVAASGYPTPSYQWQRMPSGSGTWQDLANSGNYSTTNTAVLRITNANLAMNGDQFRCVATNSVGAAASSPATLVALTPAAWARSVLLMNRTSVSSEVAMGNVDPAWRMAAAGDFNGDGKSDILWQNKITGEHTVLLMNGTALIATVDLGTTVPTWQMAGTGDFNGDGHTDILWQNIATGQHSIWLMNGTTNTGNIELPTTDPIWRMTGTGDFNGDGQTDILWQNIVTGQHSIWLMSGTTNIGNIELGTTDPIWRIPGTGDFNGDGQTDILWQNTITGQMSLWLMSGTTVISGTDFGTADPTWQAAGVGDFNADGKVDVLQQKKIDIRNDLNGDGFTDILWQNTSTGQHSIWLMNGTTYLSNTELSTTAPVWQIAGTGDFNADGQTDILWHNLLTGQHSVWLMKGTTYQSGVDLETTDPAWQIAGTGDFNGDAQTDILFQNTLTGQRNLWLMTGTTHNLTVDLGTIAPAWEMVGTGDFNADGHTDILWQNTLTGQHTLWLMTGVVSTGAVDLGTTAPVWQMVATGDFNGDGSIDILWQNTVTGQHSVWLMSGTTSIGNTELGTTEPIWLIVN